MSEKPRSSRRGFLGWVGRAGLTTVGAVAGVTATQQPASAHGYHYGCCHLALPHNGGCLIKCIQGWQFRTWTCCSGSTRYECAECQQGGTSCWNGTSYRCSRYRVVGSC
jgi:hypothetical protein